MGQQTLKTIISLSGRVDNSFGQMGDQLLLLGSQLEGISNKIWNFGKESATAYAGYEDTMLMVEHLGGYTDKTMGALDDYNKTIAQTTRYTMDQAAEAELLMARLGLNLDQTKALMPSVLNTATAANIDLSTSLDYLYYSLSALGMPMEYATTLSDQMAKAADISAADIDGLGESMQRLGSGLQYFAGGSDEVLAILAGISQFGEDMQGSNAGTQLRNFMLTLLAPTASKSKLMKELGVTEEAWAEFESYMEDASINVTDTADAMNELGLKMYDSNGKLKPAIQVIGELDAALNSLTDAEQKEYLGKLFGKRTTITAENLLAALETIIEYQNLIENNSAGYGEALAGAQESGLGGSMREFAASFDALKTIVGEQLAPEVTTVTDFFKSGVNWISNLDEPKLNALVGAGEGLAAAGPGILIAGAGLKLIGSLANPIGRAATMIGLAGIAIGAVIGYYNKLDEINFEEKFGEMELDKEALIGHVQGISAEFTAAYGEVDKYNKALGTAVESFTTASTTLSSNLLTSMITGTTLTPEQISNIEGLGKAMGDSLQDGINASFDATAEYLMMLWGDDTSTDPQLASVAETLTRMHATLTAQAQQLGADFGATLGTAMDDGIITGDEYAVIMEKMQKYNEAMSIAAGADRAGEMAVSLHKAQSVSWDSASDFLAEQQAILNADLEAAETEYLRNAAQMGYYYDYLIENAKDAAEADRYRQEKELLLGDGQGNSGSMYERYASQIQGYKDEQTQLTWNVLDALMGQGDDGAAWKYMRDLYNAGALEWDDNRFLVGGKDFASYLPDGYTNSDMMQLLDGMHGDRSKYLGRLKTLLPDFMYDVIENMLNSADELMGELTVSETEKEAAAKIAERSGTGGSFDAIMAAIAAGDEKAREAAWEALSKESKMEYSYLMDQVAGNYYDLDSELFKGDQHPFAQAGSQYRLDYALYKALYGTPTQPAPSASTPFDAEGLTENAGETGSSASEALLEGWGTPVLTGPVDSAGMEAAAAAAGEETRKKLLESWGNPTLMAQIFYKGGGNGNQNDLPKYADGGRATQASIFGEAGPEWAIPEEHSTRVANLFDAARRASGFTWPELIARNGGLNAGSKTPSQLIYSPVIHASDTASIAQLLLEDKERLDSWWKEKQMRNEVEVYA